MPQAETPSVALARRARPPWSASISSIAATVTSVVAPPIGLSLRIASVAMSNPPGRRNSSRPQLSVLAPPPRHGFSIPPDLTEDNTGRPRRVLRTSVERDTAGGITMDVAAARAPSRPVEDEGGARLFRLLPRIPTPIVVAVLGLVLGSWFIPAFTRQWDDRQKAGELKAVIISKMASATGRALLEAHQSAVAVPGVPAPQRSIPPAGKEWSVAN